MNPFLDRLKTDTLDLLVATRDYLVKHRVRDQSGRAPDEIIKMTAAMFGVTATLSHILAWVFSRKAVAAGELTPTEAIERFRINVSVPGIADDESLPQRLRELCSATRTLLARASRLDAMTASSTALEMSERKANI